MKRIEKQSRVIFGKYRHDILKDKQPKAINTEKFAAYIAENTGYELEIVVVPMGEVLRGIIVRNTTPTPKIAKIFISDSNNECWTRFTLVKEICHLFLIHEDTIENDNALEMAKSLMRHVTFMPDFLPAIDDGDSELAEYRAKLHKTLKEKFHYEGDDFLNDFLKLTNPIGVEEASAVVAAIEIMIPAINKEWIKQQIESGMTLYALASQLKVPKLILEYRLDQWFIKYH